jgi:uncharacterized membrane protein YvbJ
MVMHCQECGKKAEGNFQFCPFCGKKLIKPKICSNCGAKLKEKFMFCPECGKKWGSSEKHLIPKPKKAEKTMPSKKANSKAASSKMSLCFLKNFKRPGKKVLMIISVICVVLVVAAAVIVFYPFNNANTNNSSGGRTFSITIENNYSSNVDCYLTVGQLRYGENNNDYSIQSGESFPIVVVEDALNPILLSSDYDITLYVSSDDGESQATAFDVTESATFVISGDAESISVNCTESQ